MAAARIKRIILASFLLATSSFGLDPNNSLDQYGRQTWRTENGLPQNTVHAIAQTPDGYLWFGTDGGLARFDGFQFITYDVQNTPALADNRIQRLALRANGDLWIGTGSGNAYLDGTGFHAFDQNPPAPQHRVKDAWDFIWEGTESGLLRQRNGTTERFPPSDPLSEAAILVLFKDRQGNLWIGTDVDGVSILRDQKFASFANRTLGLDRPVRSVLGDREGGVWIGTADRGLVYFKDNVFHPAPFNAQLSSEVILALAEAPNGDVLAGTPDGLNRIHDGRRVFLWTTENGLPEDFVRSVLADPDGSVWVGTRSGLSHIEGTSVTTYTQSNGLGSDMVGALLRDRNGDLWIGTLHGLTRLHGRQFTNFTVEDGLSSNVITDLLLDDESRLWIATQGGGLDLFAKDTFSRLTPDHDVPGNISGLAMDSDGGLWLATDNGILRADKDSLLRIAETGKGDPHPARYGTADGLTVAECSEGGHPAITQTATGNIWFALARGVALLKTSELKPNSYLPPVVLESVSLDEHVFSPAEAKTVSPRYSHLAFQYAGLDFRAPTKVHYRYQLAGFDREWTDAGTRRVAYYTNLPPHQYELRVMASNEDGLWTPGKSLLRFRVWPHAYQTWWFRSILALALASVVLGIYYWRIRQVRAQYNAVLLERTRIAREIHDTLAQGFVGVSVQLELVARLLNTSVTAAREQLDQTRSLVRQSIADARQSIWELRSQSPGQQDFAAKLSQMAKSTTASSNARIELRVTGTYRPLSPQVEAELFRIGQEAVANAVRHSGAKTISIALAFDTRKLRMTVADDGCGFDAANGAGPQGHYGLKGMRERADLIHADLRVQSEKGKGTTVIVEAPAK